MCGFSRAGSQMLWKFLKATYEWSAQWLLYWIHWTRVVQLISRGCGQFSRAVAHGDDREHVLAKSLRELLKIDMMAASASNPEDAASIRRQVEQLGGSQPMSDAVVKAFVTSFGYGYLVEDGYL
mmetsp:Transcript_71657/g.164236  ORF Transcript_71657/g.164236 Transcript_71657/m.164236 type:complete len:124 (+) Transcript_71657:576-947(+)